jgi:hypothetical protein
MGGKPLGYESLRNDMGELAMTFCAFKLQLYCQMLQLPYLEEHRRNQFYTRVAYDLKYGNLFLLAHVITFIFVKNVLRIRP